MTDLDIVVEEAYVICRLKGVRVKKGEIIAAIVIIFTLVVAAFELYFRI